MQKPTCSQTAVFRFPKVKSPVPTAARLGGPAIRQHEHLGSARSIHNLDDVARMPGLGEPRDLVGKGLLIAEGARHAVVQDVEAFVIAHGLKAKTIVERLSFCSRENAR